MGWFGIGKEKQRQPSQDAATDAELAFAMWEEGWEGWIASEPALPVQPESRPAASGDHKTD